VATCGGIVVDEASSGRSSRVVAAFAATGFVAEDDPGAADDSAAAVSTEAAGLTVPGSVDTNAQRCLGGFGNPIPIPKEPQFESCFTGCRRPP
jgi:hypothetical protein